MVRLIASLPENCPEVLIGAVEYGDRETGVINSHNLLAALSSKRDYSEHESEMRVHVDANNFGESQGGRCLCQEPGCKWVELEQNTFTRVYALPKMGGDLFEGIAARMESFGGGLGLERAGIGL